MFEAFPRPLVRVARRADQRVARVTGREYLGPVTIVDPRYADEPIVAGGKEPGPGAGLVPFRDRPVTEMVRP